MGRFLQLVGACVASACVLMAPITPTRAADDTITIVAKFYATAGRESEVEAFLLKTLAFVHKSEPNITYRYYRSKKDPALFVTYEIYPNQAALTNHMKVVLPASKETIGATPEGLFARPMEADVLREISN